MKTGTLFTGALRSRSHAAVWALFLVLLPVTSLPLLVDLTGASTVAPASAIPLAWLVVAWFVPFLLRGGRLPRLAAPFLGFISVALLASAAAFWINIPSFKNKSIVSQELPALATLALGAAFYLLVSAWLTDDGRLRRSLQLINLSGLLLLAWSGAQIYVITALDNRYPPILLTIQSLVSIQDLFPNRISGFSYEPSWLAHQLNLVYLPFWLAASVQRFSAHRQRFWLFSVENVLLAGGVVVLLFAISRIGLLSFLLVLSYLVLQGSLALIRRVRARLLSQNLTARNRRWLKVGVSIVLAFMLLMVYLAVLLGIAYGLSQVDERLADLFKPELFVSASLYSLTSRLQFAERVVYWATGWRIFNDYPLLGVGLGNAGFFFPDKMPSYGWNLWEITRTFNIWSIIPNTKSMWIRVLAETGILGMAFFATWFLFLWRGAWTVRKGRHRLHTTAAMAGQFTILAFIVEGFSIDSFAMPYLWIAMGILTATITLSFAKPGEMNEP